MNKPNWCDAPDWANWLAQDGDGEWWWHECKPIYNDHQKEYNSYGQYQMAQGIINPPCEARPE